MDTCAVATGVKRRCACRDLPTLPLFLNPTPSHRKPNAMCNTPMHDALYQPNTFCMPNCWIDYVHVHVHPLDECSRASADSNLRLHAR